MDFTRINEGDRSRDRNIGHTGSASVSVNSAFAPMPHDYPQLPEFGADHTSMRVLTALGTDSTLQQLPLYAAELDLAALGAEAAELFNRYPDLPGILLKDATGYVGIISRYRFLDYLLLPKGCELFLTEPLSVIYSYARMQPLILQAATPILVAARQALRRPIELQGEPIWVQGGGRDRLLNPHDLNVAYWQIRGIETQIRYERTQAAMLQNQKMAALGRLVDGVSHEILDPLGFVWGNLSHLSRYCQDLLKLVDAYEQVLPEGQESAITAMREEIELTYLKTDLPNTLNSIQSGAERLKQLATSLQNFCYIDEVYPKPADLHQLIDGIVLLLKSRLTTKIQVVRNYASLPPLTCFAGQLSQVFMNILSHCVDRLLSQAARQQVAADLEIAGEAAAIAPLQPPTINISTQILTRTNASNASRSRWVAIKITDNGPELSEPDQQQIRDSFSVRQRLARETDLAVSYRIITAKHGGSFEVQSTSGNSLDNNGGLSFTIQIPIYNDINTR